MRSNLEGRLARLEKRRAGPAHAFVELPTDAWDYGHEHLERVMAEAIREHRVRTGYGGPVLVGPPSCETEEEWLQRHGRSG
jgi:hypothetical protein